MAIKQFAIPLDAHSQRPGEAPFKQLADAGSGALFELSNVTASTSLNELNLMTRKNGVTQDHKFNVAVTGGTAKVMLTAGNLATIFSDANGGDWNYVEAKWTLGQVDTPDSSNLYITQDGRTYNFYGW